MGRLKRQCVLFSLLPSPHFHREIEIKAHLLGLCYLILGEKELFNPARADRWGSAGKTGLSALWGRPSFCAPFLGAWRRMRKQQGRPKAGHLPTSSTHSRSCLLGGSCPPGGGELSPCWTLFFSTELPGDPVPLTQRANRSCPPSGACSQF